MHDMTRRNFFNEAAARERCLRFRKRILDISQQVQALHIGSAYSCTEIVDCMYHGLMRRGLDGTSPDTFLMSKGHGCMIQYVILEEHGVLRREDLDRFGSLRGGRLQLKVQGLAGPLVQEQPVQAVDLGLQPRDERGPVPFGVGDRQLQQVAQPRRGVRIAVTQVVSAHGADRRLKRACARRCLRSAAPSDRARSRFSVRHDRTWRHEGDRLALRRSARDVDPDAPRSAGHLTTGDPRKSLRPRRR